MLKKLIVFCLSIILLNGCQTHFPVLSDSVDAEQAECDKPIETIELTDIDYLLYANKMIDSMTQSNNVQREVARGRMPLTIFPVQNNTSEAIEMAPVNLTIKNRLIRSGLFIVDNSSSNKYQLSGSFDEMAQSANDCGKKYKSFSLQLKNNQSNHILWSEEKRFN